MIDLTDSQRQERDLLYCHLADDHGYDFSGLLMHNDWGDLWVLHTLHDELHREGGTL
jgi:hypothetical protein